MRLQDLEAVTDRVRRVVQFIESDPQMRKTDADVLRQLRPILWALQTARTRMSRQLPASVQQAGWRANGVGARHSVH